MCKGGGKLIHVIDKHTDATLQEDIIKHDGMKLRFEIIGYMLYEPIIFINLSIIFLSIELCKHHACRCFFEMCKGYFYSKNLNQRHYFENERVIHNDIYGFIKFTKLRTEFDNLSIEKYTRCYLWPGDRASLVFISHILKFLESPLYEQQRV